MDFPYVVIVIALLLPALFFFRLSNPKPQGSPKAYPLIGNLPQFLKHRHRLLQWLTELLAASPTASGVITTNPANLEHLLKSNFENYPKGPRLTSLMRDSSDGGSSTFEFNTGSLRIFVVENVQQEITKRLLPRLRSAAASGATVDLQDLLERFAFDNVCQDPAGGDGLLRRGFAAAFRDATAISAARFRYAVPGMWKLKRLLNVGSERRLKESISTVDDFARRIIRSRKKELRSPAVAAEGFHHQDLLSRFITGGDDSDEFLRDIVVSFILAGRETTSSALTWFFWLLSERPDVERKILEEIRSVRARSEGEEEEKESFGFEELREMNYLHAAITEAMRLYPPVPNSSHCLADDVLPDGTKVGKGWFVSYNAYAMGRMAAVWGKTAAKSIPVPGLPRWTRTCLGKEMAYIQMKSIAACLIENFTLEVARAGRPEMLLSVTLRAKGGLPVRLRGRTTPR
ncbi:unnamed protein product [Spirodela intermedia]|uniref:Uncharacterized protein n=1 Tax=Spirodela intermedia TaxID=51605 RepID=A0A7I8IWP7_SPIIN|nr:unnamed protein product [Spirodela intermedia]CAA6662014.1 unnamed protein product [Spirodela intermedia]